MLASRGVDSVSSIGDVSTTDEIKTWADRLVAKGEVVLGTEREVKPGGGMLVLAPNFVEVSLFEEWRVQVLNLLERVVGRDSAYFERAAGVGKRNDVGNARSLFGILKAFRDDVENGGLRRVEGIVSAEVFSDLLDQAHHRLQEGYVAPAAGLVGAVLERELRRLCSKQGLKVKRSDGLATMNKKLVAAKVYNAIKSKKIDVWTKIRNDADHGHFSDVKSDDVNDMLRGVLDFVGESTS